MLGLLLVSCSSGAKHAAILKGNNAKLFAYRDVSGEFECSREVKFANGKLATRVQVLAETGGTERLLEKTFAVAAVGSVKSQGGRVAAIRPELSQHTVWLEGKKYFSQLKLNTRKRVLEAITDSPEAKWKGTRELKIPKGRIFCFYSQLPECLLLSDLLSTTQKGRRRASFILVWDSWPYHQEHFTGLKESPFVSASITAESERKADKRYSVEAAGQTISLHFSHDNKFVRMFWTAQGISLLPPGEKQESQEI
jgi:hypothetical protein